MPTEIVAQWQALYQQSTSGESPYFLRNSNAMATSDQQKGFSQTLGFCKRDQLMDKVNF